jgi:hypothetical protein
VATSVRLSDELRVEASVYAGRCGISLNALLAVALRDYLDHPDRRAARGPDVPGVPAGRPLTPSTVGKPARQVLRAVGGNRKQRRARGSGGKR